MRNALLALVVLAILMTWTPLGEAQTVLDRGAAVTPTMLRLMQGQNATLMVDLWNNGTSADHARVGAISGLNATLSHPDGADVAPLSRATVFVKLHASQDQPLVEYQFDLHVTWNSSGSHARTFRVSVTIEPAPTERPVPGGARGAALVGRSIDLELGQTKAFELWVWNNGTSSDRAYFSAGASPAGLSWKTPPAQDIAGGTSVMVEYTITGDAPGNYAANVKVAWGAANSTEVPLNVTVHSTQRVDVVFEPATLTVDAGDVASFDVRLYERSGRAARLHVDVNTTDPPSTHPVTISMNNMIVDIEPYGEALVRIRAATWNETTAGEHRIVATASDDATSAVLGSGFGTLHVRGGQGPTPNVSLYVSPDRATVAPGQEAEFSAMLVERAGRETTVNLYVNTSGADSRTSPRADPSYAPLTLAPYETRNVSVRVASLDETPPGEHPIRMTLWASPDGFILARANATLVVEREEPPTEAQLWLTLRLDAHDVAALPEAMVDLNFSVSARSGDAGGRDVTVRAEVEAEQGLVLAAGRVGLATVTADQIAPGNNDWTFEASSVHFSAARGTPPGTYVVYLLAEVEGRPEATQRVRVNFTVLAGAGLTVRTEPAQAPPNATTNVTVHLTNGGPAPIDVSYRSPGSTSNTTSIIHIKTGASAVVRMAVTVPANATPGSLHSENVAFTYAGGAATADLAILVLPVQLPPLEPPVDENAATSALAAAGGLVKEYPGAAISLGIAGAAAVAVPLARRQHLRYLGIAATLPLYTRLAKPDMLSDERRGQIHALIAAQPGIHMDALRQAVGISMSAIVHHLRMLERHGFLTSHRDGKLRRFYVSGAAPSALVASPTAMQEQVLGLLAAGPMTRPEIAARLGLSQQGVSYHIKNLERAGRVTVKREGGATRVHRVVDVVVTTTEFTRVR